VLVCPRDDEIGPRLARHVDDRGIGAAPGGPDDDPRGLVAQQHPGAIPERPVEGLLRG
jgi:hypothetical protein